MYHAYAEKMKLIENDKKTPDFMGLNESSEEEPDPEAMKLFESDLLCGFGTWMEKLTDGNLKRYRVDLWPNMHLL
jgi:hypothetical protein